MARLAGYLLAHLEKMFDVLLVAAHSFRSPHEPKLEDVIMAAALDHLIASIVGDVVVFVLLEKVVGAHLVAVDQKTLATESSSERELNDQTMSLKNPSNFRAALLGFLAYLSLPGTLDKAQRFRNLKPNTEA